MRTPRATGSAAAGCTLNLMSHNEFVFLSVFAQNARVHRTLHSPGVHTRRIYALFACFEMPGGKNVVLVGTADPGTGVMRHADAGYDIAIETAQERGVDLPMING